MFAQNAQGHAAAASNDAPALAGAAPQPVTGLTAQVIAQGVLLHWQTASVQNGTVLEIQRTLLKAPPTPQNSPFVIAQAPSQKPAQQTIPQKPSATKKPAPPVPMPDTLRVQPKSGTDPGAALDTSVQWEATYRYTLARVVEYAAGQPASATPLRIQSQLSTPVQLQTLDSFPPSTPQGLVAVVVSAAMNGGRPAVDLSWAANTEPDFAQYLVYRRELAANDMAPANTAAIQIAPAAGAASNALLVTPAFQDNTVLPGHRYAYSVSAVDLYGNASALAPEVIANLPAAATAGP